MKEPIERARAVMVEVWRTKVGRRIWEALSPEDRTCFESIVVNMVEHEIDMDRADVRDDNPPDSR